MRSRLSTIKTDRTRVIAPTKVSDAPTIARLLPFNPHLGQTQYYAMANHADLKKPFAKSLAVPTPTFNKRELRSHYLPSPKRQ